MLKLLLSWALRARYVLEMLPLPLSWASRARCVLGKLPPLLLTRRPPSIRLRSLARASLRPHQSLPRPAKPPYGVDVSPPRLSPLFPRRIRAIAPLPASFGSAVRRGRSSPPARTRMPLSPAAAPLRSCTPTPAVVHLLLPTSVLVVARHGWDLPRSSYAWPSHARATCALACPLSLACSAASVVVVAVTSRCSSCCYYSPAARLLPLLPLAPLPPPALLLLLIPTTALHVLLLA